MREWSGGKSHSEAQPFAKQFFRCHAPTAGQTHSSPKTLENHQIGSWAVLAQFGGSNPLKIVSIKQAVDF